MTTATAEKAKTISPIVEFRNSMAKLEGELKVALPKHIETDRFIRVVITAVQMNPDLLAANRQSLYSACMKSAHDGLLPDGRESAFVTFGKTVAYMPMVSGILKLVRNSGEIATVTAQMVHKNDKFSYFVDDKGEHINHQPEVFGDRGDAIGVYAMAVMKNGEVYVEPMNKAQIESIKAISKSQNIWKGAFEYEMWKKSAIRRLSKRLPKSTDLPLHDLVERDNDLFDLNRTETTDKPTNTSSRLSNLVSDIPEAEVVEESVIEEQEIPI